MNRNAQLIFDAIVHSTDHPTAELLHQRLKDQGCAMALATVYNNLTALQEQGMVRKVRTASGPDRYDVPRRHDHLVCARCGKLSDATLEDLTDSIQRQIGTDIISYDLQISYLCDECAKDTHESLRNETEPACQDSAQTGA